MGRSRGYRITYWNDTPKADPGGRSAQAGAVVAGGDPLDARQPSRVKEFRFRLGPDRPGRGQCLVRPQFERSRTMSVAHSSRSAAITGAGGGLGRDIALGLAAKGYVVFGTAMSATEIKELRDASGGRVSLAVCDITKEQGVKTWAAGVSDALGEGGLDLLINNAGILTPGPIEVLPLDAIRREFDVNVFGALSVMNAFLPALRKARGRIVQLSTWTASLPLPFNGPSGASKAAMEVFAAVYRAELKPFGIDVVVAPAGNMKTGGPAKTAAALKWVADGMTSEQRELYGRAFEKFATALNGMQGNGIDSAAAAKRVIELAEQVPAPSRAPIGPDAEEMLRVAREKSDTEQNALRLKLVGLG
jgi:NAD(P)-dependent dehydrogenase (short-subunit alcohol dehydrogenase family)